MMVPFPLSLSFSVSTITTIHCTVKANGRKEGVLLIIFHPSVCGFVVYPPGVVWGTVISLLPKQFGYRQLPV
jgi:hypothetical protein